jgi:hypothetical protein
LFIEAPNKFGTAPSAFSTKPSSHLPKPSAFARSGMRPISITMASAHSARLDARIALAWTVATEYRISHGIGHCRVGFSRPLGTSAGRELGPMAALWYHF